MTPFLQDADVTLYQGDVLDVLRELPDETFHMACTSPPFYGLRDYGTGSWEGGDEGCDHKPPPRPARATRPDAHGFGTRSVMAAQDEGATAYRDVCGKCGAQRVDQQDRPRGYPRPVGGPVGRGVPGGSAGAHRLNREDAEL